MNIKYPVWKVRGTPTPNETLFICNGCGTARWTTETGGNPPCCYNCTGRKGGFLRLRPATTAETAEGKKHIKEIIG